jgi:peptidoglycan/LPS O-acetylase OafA/YrhL
MSGQGQRSIPYQPALDGLRAVAVILVLLFHLGVGWMTGGYLGVSVFFTLSGFLITTLLVTELQRSGDIRLARFYGRRARRLLPASLVCLAGACALIAWGEVPDRSGLRWYIFGGLFQFANWVPLGLSNSYAELFDALSPTDHFWSLAIEEQFYWLWPVTILGLFKLVSRRTRSSDWTGRLLTVLAVMFVLFGLSAPLTAQLWSGDAAYFATWARIPEILAGALLAVFVMRVTLPAWTKWLAPLGLGIVVVLAVVTPAGSGFAYEGALPIFALVSAALIAGLHHAAPVTTLLAQRPLVFLGRISYGIYLYHWPVFVVLTPERTGWSIWPLSVVRLAVTFAIAIVSFFMIEQPIRQGRVLPRPRLGLLATAVAIPLVAVLGVTQVSNTSAFEATTGVTLAPVDGSIAPLIAVATTTAAAPATPAETTPAAATPTTVDPSTNATTATPATTTIPAASTTSTTTQITPSRPVRMLVIGDSTALATAVGLTNWADEHPELAQVEVQGFGGCGLMNDGERLFKGEWLPKSDGCTELFDVKVPARVRDGGFDIVVVISSFWEVTDHRLAPDQPPMSIADAAYRDQMLWRYTAYNQTLIDAGAPRIAWVFHPETDYAWDLADEPADDPARYTAFYDVQQRAADPFPGVVSTVDFAAWSDARGLTTDHAARLDGVHWTPEVATAIAEQWLGNEIVQRALH